MLHCPSPGGIINAGALFLHTESGVDSLPVAWWRHRLPGIATPLGRCEYSAKAGPAPHKSVTQAISSALAISRAWLREADFQADCCPCSCWLRIRGSNPREAPRSQGETAPGYMDEQVCGAYSARGLRPVSSQIHPSKMLARSQQRGCLTMGGDGLLSSAAVWPLLMRLMAHLI